MLLLNFILSDVGTLISLIDAPLFNSGGSCLSPFSAPKGKSFGEGVHVVPSPMNPYVHLHWNDPTLLWHSAFSWQLLNVAFPHSLISIKIHRIRYIFFSILFMVLNYIRLCYASPAHSTLHTTFHKDLCEPFWAPAYSIIIDLRIVYYIIHI